MEKVVPIIVKVITKLNIKNLYNHPMQAFLNLLNEFKDDFIMNNINNIIIAFLNNNFEYLKDFIVPFIKSMFSNLEFIKKFDLSIFINILKNYCLFQNLFHLEEIMKIKE